MPLEGTCHRAPQGRDSEQSTQLPLCLQQSLQGNLTSVDAKDAILVGEETIFNERVYHWALDTPQLAFHFFDSIAESRTIRRVDFTSKPTGMIGSW